jgi:hypothetical protein
MQGRLVTSPTTIVIRDTDTAALVVAVIGLSLAIASLVWQAATFSLSGPRVRVYLAEGLRNPVTGALMLSPLDAYPAHTLQQLQASGFSEHVVGVQAVNHGRLAATVVGWSLDFGAGPSHVNPGDPRNPPLPYRLESHSDATWYTQLDPLRAMQPNFADQSVEGSRARGVVRLADRRTAMSSDSMVIRADRVTFEPAPRGAAARLARGLPGGVLRRR